jgi:heme exporter protein A
LIEALNLSCARGDRTLFCGLSLRLQAGELLHVTGRNGSGKTTLLRTLCGLSRPAAGTIRWGDEDIRALGDEYRRELAYVGHANAIHGELTAAENLRASACLSDAVDAGGIDAVLERVNLGAQRDFPAKVLSQGQKRRLALARLALAARRLWVLDEPFAALDTRSTDLVTELLTGHLTEGGLVVLTSHQEFTVEVAGMLSLRLDA